MDKVLSELKQLISEDLAKTKSSEQETLKMEKLELENSVTEKPLVLKRNLCYIVSAVIIEDGKVLMIKEAKKSCRGLWYLPAGRLEMNESFIEGVKREVLEESGLTFEPTSLICVDSSMTLNWQRLNFTGNVTGGKLKSIKKADKESMEARWFKPEEVLNQSIELRASDIIPLIKSTIKWKEINKRDPSFISMPVPVPHSRITIRVVLVSNDDNKIKVLLDKENSMGFLQKTPSHSGCSVLNIVDYIIKRLLKIDKMDYKVHGIVTIEHTGKLHGVADGACFTLLAEIPKAVSVPTRYEWWEVADETLKSKIKKLFEKGCIQLV